MVLGGIRTLGIGIAIGIAIDRFALELRRPADEQFSWMRARMNDQVNPWLLEHGIPGSGRAEIGTLEHVGRTSGTIYYTPVHPTLRGDTVLVPAPMGVGSQWARNVLHAGRARLQLHDTLYELDEPRLIGVGETGFFAAPIAAPFDRMGWRYVRFHVVATARATFGTHAASMPAELPADLPVFPGSLEDSTDIPVEPRMVTRETAPA
jgi:hypothetical protein